MVTKVPNEEAWAEYGTPGEVVEALVVEASNKLDSDDQATASRTILASSFMPGGGKAPDDEIMDTVELLVEKLLPRGSDLAVEVNLTHHRHSVRTVFRNKWFRRSVVVGLSTLSIVLIRRKL